MGERKRLYKGQLCKKIFMMKMRDYTERGKERNKESHQSIVSNRGIHSSKETESQT